MRLLSHVREEDTVVTLSWGGTATENEDYYFSGPLPRQISVPANELSSEIRFLLQGIVDGVDEDSEEITVSGQAPGVEVKGTAIPLIDRPASTITLSLAPSSIREGETQTVFATLELDQERPTTTEVDFFTSGSARYGEDYDRTSISNHFIPVNESRFTVEFMNLNALVDGLCEGPESIWVEGREVLPDGVGLPMRSATITLIDTATDCFDQSFRGSAAPDAVGADTAAGPAVGAPLAPLTLMAGGHIETVGLAEAFTGESLTYALETSDPEVAAVTLVGDTATVASGGEGMATVTVRATNDFGTAVQTFAVTVVTDPAEAVAVEGALAAVGRGLLTGITSTVERRFRGAGETRAVVVAGRQMPLGQAPLGGASPPLSMLAATTARRVDEAAADAAMRDALGMGMVTPSAHQMLPVRDVTFEDLLRGSAFALSLGGGQDPAGGAAPAAAARWTVWGGGDVQSFRGAPGGAAYDGDVRTGHVGVDFQRAGWLAGVALSRSAATAGYEFDGVVTGAGALETKLTNVQPYLRWAPQRGTEVWTILGAGGGSISNLRSHVGDRLETSDLSMRLGVAGVRQALPAVGRVDVAVRGDVGLLRLATGAGSEAIDDMSVDARRLRVGLEVSRSVSLGAATLAPFAEAGGRQDGGHGQTGSGLELAGGLRLTGFASRLALEARGHVLAVHTASGYAERGGSVTATWTPSGDSGGRGLAVTLLPRWGAPGGAGTLWFDEALGRYGAGGSALGAGALDTRVAYGFGVGRNVLAPFSEYGRSAGGYQRLRFGAHLVGDRGLRFELGGERLDRAAAGASVDHRFLLVGGMSF